MKISALVVLFVLVIVATTDKSRIRKLTESNLEQFAKDNSYWLIQISGKVLDM